ncbi:glycosyltransferase [Nanoarchaeota archaeon]
MKEKLSIIIPALNEEKYLPILLDSIARQNYPCEVIVADAQSDDNTKEVAKSYGVKVISARRGLPAYGRNDGAEIAKGDILLFLDADVVLPDNFLKKNIKEFKRRKIDVASCYISPISNNPLDVLVMKGIVNAWLSVFQYVNPHALGFCIFSRKSAHEEINGFDETIKFLEDADYVKRAYKNNFKFRMLRTAVSASMRRFEQESRMDLLWRYLKFNTSRLLKGEIRNNVDYSFGKF